MVVLFLIFTTVVAYVGCCLDVHINAARLSTWGLIQRIDQNLLTYAKDGIITLSDIMIPQLAALLAICLTVFVFLFAELNSRVQDHPSESIICSGLQKDFALRVERLSIESMLLITLDYFSVSVYGLSHHGINIGHFVYAMLVMGSFWASACMIWYCVDVVQYQRHLKWRAWNLTKDRYANLKEVYARTFDNEIEYPTGVSNFWIEYAYTSQLVCTIAGEPEGQTAMDERIIDQFAKAARQQVTTGDVLETTDMLAEALKCLFRYQSILSVLEVYKIIDFNYEDSESDHEYAIAPVTTSLEILNYLLTLWNKRFRRRPKMDDNAIPGIKADRPEQRAAQIARGLWNQIVRGDGQTSSVGSHRFPNMDFSELDFSNGQLQDVKMQFCRFVETSFDGANLNSAHFEDCDLRRASFVDIDCTNLVFTNSNLTGIHITDLQPTSSDSAEPTLTPKKDCKLSTLSFDGCSLEGARIYASDPSLPFDLTEAIFSETDFQVAEIRDAVLDRCTFKNAWFSATLFENCKGNSADLSNAKFFGTTGLPSIRSCTFERSNGSGCLFSNTRLETTEFPYFNAANSIFENCVISHSSFDNATLSHASILFAKLSGVSFVDTDLTEASILDSRLEHCDFDGSAGDSPKILNGDAYRVTLQHVHFAKPDFSRTCFSNCIIRQSSLRRALFHRTNFDSTGIIEVLLPSADCTDAVFRFTHIQQATFSRSLFDRVDWQDVRVCDSDFSRATFRHAKLRDCTFRHCVWDDVDFYNASLERCRFNTDSKHDHDALRKLLRRAGSLSEVMVDDACIDEMVTASDDEAHADDK